LVEQNYLQVTTQSQKTHDLGKCYEYVRNAKT